MAAVVRALSRQRRYLWLLAGACLLIAVPWGTASAIRILRGPPIAVPGDDFQLLAMSPGGRTLYAGSYRFYSNGTGMLVPVDLATGKTGRQIAIGAVPQGLVITPNGRMLYAMLDDGLITPVDLVAGRAMKPIHVKGGAQSMAVSPDGRTLYVGTNGESLVAIDIATGNRRAPIPLPHPANPDAVSVWPGIAVTPDGKKLYVDAGEDTVVPVDLRETWNPDSHRGGRSARLRHGPEREIPVRRCLWRLR